MGSFQDFCCFWVLFCFFFSHSNTDPGTDKSMLWRTAELRFISSNLIPSLMNNEKQRCDQKCAAMFCFCLEGCIVFSYFFCSFCHNTCHVNWVLGRRLLKVSYDCKLHFSDHNMHL